MSSPRTWLRLQPLFEKAGEPGIFSVPEPRNELGIFPSSRVQEETRYFSKSQGLYKGGRDRNFSKPRAYMGEKLKE